MRTFLKTVKTGVFTPAGKAPVTKKHTLDPVPQKTPVFLDFFGRVN